MARDRRGKTGTKGPFGAVFVDAGDLRITAGARPGVREVEAAERFDLEREGGKNKNARPVAGVARFNTPILVNAHKRVKEKQLSRLARLTHAL